MPFNRWSPEIQGAYNYHIYITYALKIQCNGGYDTVSFVFNASASFTSYSRHFIAIFDVSILQNVLLYVVIDHLLVPADVDFVYFVPRVGHAGHPRIEVIQKDEGRARTRIEESSPPTARGLILSHHYRDRHRHRIVYDSQRTC